jgi:hypothetical protein
MYFSDYKQHKDAKINHVLLWEYDMKKFDWNLMKGEVVERVLELGREEDFYGMFNLYGGIEKVKDIIINDVPYLKPTELAFVENIFDIDKEKIKCYKNQQLRRKLLSY